MAPAAGQALVFSFVVLDQPAFRLQPGQPLTLHQHRFGPSSLESSVLFTRIITTERLDSFHAEPRPGFRFATILWPSADLC